MIAVKPKTSIRPRGRAHARIKLARLLEASDAGIEARIKEIEADPLFQRLSEAGVLSIQALPRARFAARAHQGFQLRAADDGVAELLDGNGDIAKLIQRIGQSNFETCFLKDQDLSDFERAGICGIFETQARAVREFMDRLYVRAEFQDAEARSEPAKVYASVAGVSLESGNPVLGFFNREVWKGRYQCDQERYRELRATVPACEAERLDRFLRQVDLLAFRQTTLHRALELLIAKQSEYLVTGDPARRWPFTQRQLAAALEVAPSTVNHLIGNKSVEAPWRIEIPLKALLPSRKSCLRERLYELAMRRPNAGDETLRQELARVCGANLSRASILQYRKELGLGGAGARAPREAAVAA